MRPSRKEITMERMAISDTDARHVYYVFRAMHDDTCPRCGYSQGPFHVLNGLKCPACFFTLSDDECRGIESLVPRVLVARLDALERNRELLAQQGRVPRR